MSYFIAYKGHSEWKARNRWLYATKTEAEEALRDIRKGWPALAHRYKIMDADHEPGRSVLASRHGFS